MSLFDVVEPDVLAVVTERSGRRSSPRRTSRALPALVVEISLASHHDRATAGRSATSTPAPAVREVLDRSIADANSVALFRRTAEGGVPTSRDTLTADAGDMFDELHLLPEFELDLSHYFRE